MTRLLLLLHLCITASKNGDCLLAASGEPVVKFRYDESDTNAPSRANKRRKSRPRGFEFGLSPKLLCRLSPSHGKVGPYGPTVK